MELITSNKVCPRCSAPVAPTAAEGLCTRCLLSTAAHATEGPAGVLGPLEMPSLARVAKAFPHLEIVEQIGAGGMGAVYKARQPRLDRWVALKILPEELGRQAAFSERFLREARVLARLGHPHIVAVYDFGESEGLHFLLMEYVDGVNLRQAMRQGRFTPAQALALVPQVCDALQFAHDRGVMHRDIKPENILLDAQGAVKLADFGIAKLLDEGRRDPGLTVTGSALGTPHYMAPEQFERPTDVDHRADIYSLGVVFYELLTGELPIGRFAAPSSKTPLDARIDDIVLRALAKERELRQQTASQVRTEVQGISQSPKETRADAGSGDGEPLWTVSRRYRYWALAALGGLLTGLPSQWEGLRLALKYWARALVDLDRPAMAGAAWLGAGLLALAAARLPAAAGFFGVLKRPATRAGVPGWDTWVGPIAVAWVGIQGGLLGLSLATGVPPSVMNCLVPGQVTEGALGMALLSLWPLAMFAMIVGWTVRESRRPGSGVTPDRMPSWSLRLALLVLAGMSALEMMGEMSRTMGTGIVVGFPSVAVPACVAWWSGDRRWRALSLAMSVCGIFGSMMSTGGVIHLASTQGWAPWVPEYTAGREILVDLPRFDPVQQVVAAVASMLIHAVLVVAFLRPDVKRAFGVAGDSVPPSTATSAAAGAA